MTGRDAPGSSARVDRRAIGPAPEPRGDVLAATALGLAVSGTPDAPDVLVRLADRDRSALRRAADRVGTLDVTDAATRRAAVDLLVVAALVAAESLA